MNPMFWVLVIIFCTLLWFLLAFIFKPVGKLFYRIWKDAMDEIHGEKEEQEGKE